MMETGWKLEVNKVSNGYLLEGYTTDEEWNWELDRVTVVEDEDNEHKTMQKLLWEIKDYFGVYSSKHNKINCNVRLEDENGKVLE